MAACIHREYISSPWEKFWKENVDSIASDLNWDCGCSHMHSASQQIEYYLHVWNERSKQIAEKFSHEVLSHHRLINKCLSDKPVLALIPIEPLVGALRHPYFYCFPDKTGDETNSNFLLNKNYMLPIMPFEIFPSIRQNKAILFDLGASTYLAGAGGASQSWFVDTYSSLNVDFDRVYAWEAATIPPNEIFESVPPKVLNSLSYFNVPADPSPGALHNPLRILLENTSPDDFVVFKIDIDFSPVESSFIRQIIDNKEISRWVSLLFAYLVAPFTNLHVKLN
jgi:hypothetical protein